MFVKHLTWKYYNDKFDFLGFRANSFETFSGALGVFT